MRAWRTARNDTDRGDAIRDPSDSDAIARDPEVDEVARILVRGERPGRACLDIERDAYGVPVDPAERMQQVMLGLFDLIDEAGQAAFPEDLIGELDLVRRRFMDLFEDGYPGYGKGRAIWR
ncbi:hypothetical protein ASE88_06380 [Sphingomonas sp. Leaf38]|nr:hypothetical protein ASE88_06380 [Sphingomonas sp. Leaf38]